MKLEELNPKVRGIRIYDRTGRSDPCACYSTKLLYLISGELTYTLYEGEGSSGKKNRLSPGMLLLLPAGTVYSLKSKYMRLAVVTFDPDSRNGNGSELPLSISDFDREKLTPEALMPPFDRVTVLEDMESERDTFKELAEIFISERDFYAEVISARLKLLLLKIASLTDESAVPSSMVDNLDSYIRENIHDEISNTELGAVFGYHPFYISRMLKSKKGITLHQYVIGYRMKCALSMLRSSDLSIQEIADKTGFTDASYFTKIFKAQMGMTPKEYRNQFKDEFI